MTDKDDITQVTEAGDSGAGVRSTEGADLRDRGKGSKQDSGAAPRLGRADWLDAARSALIEGGIDSVKIGRLAKALNVTRGGFYWHFRDRDDLLDALIDQWETHSNAIFEAIQDASNLDGTGKMHALVNAWIEEEEYNPAYDAALRDWARTSERAARAVRRADNHRIAIIQGIYVDLGFSEQEAFIRARIAYFHQVGYYTLGLGESRQARRDLLPLYLDALTDGKVI